MEYKSNFQPYTFYFEPLKRMVLLAKNKFLGSKKKLLAL